MSSARKALELLSFFSQARPEIGLSQLCRLAGRDKATTYRHLQALEETGFVEQNPATKHYRLGPTIIQLAQVREATVPRKEGAMGALAALTEATGETAHVTVLSGTSVYALVNRESQKHGTRAIVDIDTFPLHATASGICAVAFGPDNLFDVAVENMKTFTETTPTSAAALQALIDRVRATGFGHADQTFEKEIQGISAPIFDQTGSFAGAVSVASVAARFTPELERLIKENLIIASRDITRNWGGTLPKDLEAAWSTSLSTTDVLETTS